MNIAPGTRLNLKIECPTCGEPISNRLSSLSAFIYGSCRNQACEMVGIGVLIERSTMQVIHADCAFIDGKPAWPSAPVNRAGEQVWPKAENGKPADTAPDYKFGFTGFKEAPDAAIDPFYELKPLDIPAPPREPLKPHPDDMPQEPAPVPEEIVRSVYEDGKANAEDEIKSEPQDWECYACKKMVGRSHILSVFHEQLKTGRCTPEPASAGSKRKKKDHTPAYEVGSVAPAEIGPEGLLSPADDRWFCATCMNLQPRDHITKVISEANKSGWCKVPDLQAEIEDDGLSLPF